jgi:hypothetical protein
MKCPSCKTTNEKWEHLLECNQYKQAWIYIYEDTCTAMKLVCNKMHILDEEQDQLKKAISQCMGHTSSSSQFNDFRQMGIEAKVNIQFTQRLRKTLKISGKDSHTLAANTLLQFIYAFKHHLWKPRCAQINLDELAQGINKNMKRNSATARNRSASNATATQWDSTSNNMRTHTPHTIGHTSPLRSPSINKLPMTERNSNTQCRISAPVDEEVIFYHGLDDYPDEVFTPVPTLPPLPTRIDRQKKAIPILIKAITGHIHSANIDSWIAIKPISNKVALIMDKLVDMTRL